MKPSANYNEEVQVPVIPPPEIKRPRLHRWHVITVVLALIIVAQAVLYVNLRLEHKSLTSDYDALEAQNIVLQSEYDTLNSSYDRLRYRINQRSQRYDVSDFITPNDSSVEQTVTQITGGWSDPSDREEFWGDIKAIYDWVVSNIEYRYDGLFPILPTDLSEDARYNDEMWQFPNETLGLERGDCEDTAILLCSMILHYGGEQCLAECVTIEGSKGGHMGVQMLVTEDKLTILDPADGYYTSNLQGSIVSQDVSTEINKWLSSWESELGSDVYVSMVFANYLDETFSSTSEYLSWMSTR